MTTTTMVTGQRWRAVELVLDSAASYDDPFADVDVTATFEGPDGAVLRRPAFWDGGRSWRVRFAAPEVGTWRMSTHATRPDDAGLHGQSATIEIAPYDGAHQVYRRGFLRVSDDGRHLAHRDGSPFFYLGDTHWILPHERWDDSNAPGVASQFRFVVDRRVEQGFTVYQSEPIWHPHPQGVAHTGADEEPVADLRHGVTAHALPGLRQLDLKFAYIADAGLVHANAMIDWVGRPADFPDDYTPERMRRLGRYWAARYGAYPVIWTIAQEIDSSFFGVYSGDAMAPWLAAIRGLFEADGYRHPLLPHQENTDNTAAHNSRFAVEEWHDGFAAQLQWDDAWQQSVLRGYWDAAKPAVVYESPYDAYWTDGRHALSALYKAYLSGMRGYGYGASGLWNDVYSRDDEPLDAGTEYELVGEPDPALATLPHPFAAPHRRMWWYDGAMLPTGDHLAIGGAYLRSLPWWRLEPRFDDPVWWDGGSGGRDLLASDADQLLVALFTSDGTRTATLRCLRPGRAYEAEWFDIRTGDRVEVHATIDAEGCCMLPERPTRDDWLLTLRLEESS